MPEEIDPQAPVMPEADAPFQDREGWLRDMDERCAEEGYFEPVGKRHWAWFHDDGPILLVTFETIDSMMSRPDRLSFGHAIASERGWSHLCVISDGETWFRDDHLYRYFDRLVDDGFFEDFDRVCFVGAGQGAHAACAYSVAAPGASVVVLRPRASYDPRLTAWDDRQTHLRRLDFTSRYGYAPDMVEAASDVWMIFDPTVKSDLMHAALFRAPNVHFLRASHAGDRLEEVLLTMGVLPRLITEACEGTMTPHLFHRLWRRRGRNTVYLREFLAKMEAQPSQWRLWTVCRMASERAGVARARRLLARLNPMFAQPDTAEETSGK